LKDTETITLDWKQIKMLPIPVTDEVRCTMTLVWTYFRAVKEKRKKPFTVSDVAHARSGNERVKV
jgi:hypothetical protein